MRRIAISLGMVLLLLLTSPSLANICPDYATAVDVQPMSWQWGNEAPVLQFVTSNLGYAYSYLREPYLSNNPYVTIDGVKNVLGAGVVYIGSHGFNDGVLLPVYSSKAARDAAGQLLIQQGYIAADFYYYDADPVWGIIARPAWFARRGSYAGQYLILGCCRSNSMFDANAFPGVRTFVGLSSDKTVDQVHSSVDSLAGRQGGWGGVNKRTTSQACANAPVEFGPVKGSRTDLELAPMATSNLAPNVQIGMTTTCNINFTSPVSYLTSLDEAIYATGGFKIVSGTRAYVNNQQVTFSVGCRYKGYGEIRARSDSQFVWYASFHSEPAGIPLAGNMHTGEVTSDNGFSPASSFGISGISTGGGDNPAALVSAFKAEALSAGGIRVTIMTDVENMTDSLVVKRVRTAGDTVVVAALPAKGPSQYIVDDPEGQLGDWYSVHERTEGQLVLQASEVAIEPVVNEPDPMPTEAEGLKLLESMVAETPPNRLAMPNSPLPILNYAIIIPNETYRAATVPIISDQEARGLVAEAYTLAQISAQYGSELAFRQAWHPYGLRYMLYCGDANNGSYHYWTGGSVPSIYMGTTGYTRYSYGPQSSYNLLPMQYWVDPALNQVQSLAYVTREAGYRSGDVDGDGRNDVAIGNLPCRSPAELTLMWRKQRLYQAQIAPSSPHITVWGDFRNLSGNDGWYAQGLTEAWLAKVPSRIGVVKQFNNDTLNYAYTYRFSLANSDLASRPIAIAPVSTTTTRVNWCSLNKLLGSDWNGTPITTLYPHLLGGSCDIGDVDRSEDTVNLPGWSRPFIETALSDTLHGPATGFGPPRGGFMMPHAKADEKEVEQLFVYGAPDGGTAHMWAMNRASDEDTANAVQYQMYLYFGDPAAPVKGQIVTPSQTASVDGQTDNGTICLSRPQPNPVRGRSLIQYTLPVAGDINLSLYDVQGRAVSRLADGWQMAGRHNVQLSPATMRLSPGLYLVHLRVGAETRTTKIMVLQ